MSRFIELMKYAFGDNADRKKILVRLQKSNDRKDMRIVKLLQSEEIESTTLIQEEVFSTVLEGAEPAQCMRDALPIIKVNTNALRYVVGEEGAYAGEVAEGAEIPIDTQDYTKRDFTIKKVGVRPLITKELIEDGLFDVIDLELRKAGAKIENKLNKDALEELLNNVANSVTVGTADQLSVGDIASALQSVRGSNFQPDKLILSSLGEGTLLADSNLAYVAYAGDNAALRRGSVGASLLGLTPMVTTVDAKDSSGNSWGGTDAGDILAIVLDGDHAGATAMRRDLTVDRYEDPIRDLVGISITMRYDVKYLMSKAMCKIITT